MLNFVKKKYQLKEINASTTPSHTLNSHQQKAR